MTRIRFIEGMKGDLDDEDSNLSLEGLGFRELQIIEFFKEQAKTAIMNINNTSS